MDEQIREVDEKPKKTTSEIERLVSKWQDQKKVLGVKDSDVEGRAQTLFGMLDVDSMRRRQYLNDMEMFKQKYDTTKATTSSNVMRIKQIEDIIVQRDSSLSFRQYCSRKKMPSYAPWRNLKSSI